MSKAIARLSVHTLTFDYLASAVLFFVLAGSSLTEPARWVALFAAAHLAAYALIYLVTIGYDWSHVRWMNAFSPADYARVHRDARQGRPVGPPERRMVPPRARFLRS